VPAPTIELAFAHLWEAEVLPRRPPILPSRHFTYPHEAEEVERGALEVLVRPRRPEGSPLGGEPREAGPFLATCALGFRDPAVPSGLWSCPRPQEICAVAGGYAYLIDTVSPLRFSMLACRPVLEIRPIPVKGLLLFVGHRSILAWAEDGQAWESGKLSDEGVSIAGIDGDMLEGTGWNMRTDLETRFRLNLRTGRVAGEPD
jgi:hypothetical protein